MLIKITNMTLESSKRKNNKLDGKIKEAEKKIFDLEQIVRTLKIQLEEEQEINADLDIENSKLKKKIQGLQFALEVINNCYGDQDTDKLLMSTTDSSLDSEATLLGDDLSSSDLKLLSETTINSSRLGLDSTTILTSTPTNVVDESLCNQTTKFPYSSDTYTKKKSRRRSKSVDFQIGEKIIIAPSMCKLCFSRPRKTADDSLTLPWCPHNRTSVSINVTSANARSSIRNYGSPSPRMPLKPKHTKHWWRQIQKWMWTLFFNIEL